MCNVHDVGEREKRVTQLWNTSGGSDLAFDFMTPCDLAQ